MTVSREFESVFLVADLSGYSALTETHGSISAAKIVTRYVEMVKEALHPDTRLAERVGDEVLVVGADALSVLRTAIALRDKVEEEPYFLTVHAGIHAGSVLEQDGQYFGTALNLASRVTSRAWGRQILCTDKVVDLAGNPEDIDFRELGVTYFKNITEPVAVFEVLVKHSRGETKVIDPVCRMQVVPDKAPAKLPFEDKTYFFCSFDCAKAFAENPDRYGGQ
ncbi:MAG: YHS domain-containing protein [Proteobacteria bacterium]|nr:YHS domain-containing protein [Pseudomonadota bacterium]